MVPLVAAGAVDRIAGAVMPVLGSVFGLGGAAAQPAAPAAGAAPALQKLGHDLHRALLDLQESGAAQPAPASPGASG